MQPPAPGNAPARPPAFGLVRDAAGRLVLIDAEGVRHEGVVVRRTFPFSAPEHWISLGTAARELALVQHLSDLPQAAQDLIREELAQREFIPRITRILSVVPLGEGLRWQIETDRGGTSIDLKNEEALHRIGEHRVVVHDIHGVRYAIPDVRLLDRASRRWLERSV